MIVISQIEQIIPEKDDLHNLGYINESKVGLMPSKLIRETFNHRYSKKKDDSVLYAIAAVKRIFEKANINGFNKDQIGVILANTFGGWKYVENQLVEMYHGDLNAINPYVATAWFATAAQGEITIEYGIRGYSKTISAGNFGGGLAIKHAYDSINEGRLKAVITGGYEAPNTKLIYRVLQKDILVDGAVMMLIEDEITSLQRGEDPKLSIEGVKTSKVFDNKIIIAAQNCNAMVYNQGEGLDDFGLDKLEICDNFGEMQLYAFQIPYLISRVYETMLTLKRPVFINYSDTKNIFSILLKIYERAL